MRTFPAAVLLSAFSLGALSAVAQTGSVHHTTTGAAARRRAAAATPPAAPAEGVDAVGTMPAASGRPKDLFVLRYIDLVTGTGELAKPRMLYTVQYTGWTTDGKKFDSSYDHDGTPFTFPVGARRVIAGWDTGFEGMRVGGKRRLIIPYQLAYGEIGHPPEIPAKSDLIFDIELVKQVDPTAPPPAATTPAPQPGSNPVTNPGSTSKPQ